MDAMTRRTLPFWPIVLDFFAFAASLIAADRMLPFVERLAQFSWRSPSLEAVAPIALAVFPVLVALLLVTDLYSIPKHWTPIDTARSLFSSLAVTALLFGLTSIAFGGVVAQSRKLVLLTLVIALIMLWGVRIHWPKVYGRADIKRRMILVGAHTFALRALLRYARENPSETEIVGVVDNFKGGLYFENLDVEFFGKTENLARATESTGVDTIVVLNDQTEYAGAVMDLVREKPQVNEVYVRAQIPLFMAQDIDMLFVQEVPLLKVFARHHAEMSSGAMRAWMDKILAAFLMALTSPLIGIAAALIRLESPGPVFYRQRRLGLRNKPFWIFKFRSMVSDAEKLSGAVLAQKNDPRVTRVGRFLRATRIDEIPQLINVLRGEMSIIGPRPERPEFQNIYLETIPWYPLRSLCKPGITGLAQVRGDYHTSTQRKLLYDVTYLANASLLLDVRILFGTVVTVLTKRGH